MHAKIVLAKTESHFYTKTKKGKDPPWIGLSEVKTIFLK